MSRVQENKRRIHPQLVGRAANGVCEDRKPYGTRPGEAEVINRILSLRASGTAMDTIAETLNAEGVAPRSDTAWYGSSVRNVLIRSGAMAS